MYSNKRCLAPVLSKSHLWFCQRITIWGSFASSCASMDSARLLHNQRNVKEVLKASPSNSKSTVLKRPYSRNEAFKSFNGLFHLKKGSKGCQLRGLKPQVDILNLFEVHFALEKDSSSKAEAMTLRTQSSIYSMLDLCFDLIKRKSNS